jgi:hypothetical protein
MRTTLNPNYSVSRMDSLFFNLFGFYPAKAGKSYEMLVGAVLKILGYDNIILDELKRGKFDNNPYQIDASLYEVNMESIMVEAKDYTSSKKSKKVQRDDLDKIAGSLLELDYSSGYFFSATDYTEDAVKKARASHLNPRMTKLSLFHLVPSVDVDRVGRMEHIQIDLVAYSISKNGSMIYPEVPLEIAEMWKSAGLPLKDLIAKNEFYYNDDQVTCTGEIIAPNGDVVGGYKFSALLSKDFHDQARANNDHIEGAWHVDNGEITYHGTRISLHTVRYSINFEEIVEPLIICIQGNPVLKIVSEDHGIDKLITDSQMKGITFEENGEITFDGSEP